MHPVSEPDLNGELSTQDVGRDLAAVSDRGFRVALPAALAAHVLCLWIAAGGLDGLWPVDLAASPGQSASSQIGDKAGEIDGVAAEVIDAAEFDKRYISFKAGRDAADSEAAVASQAVKPTAPPPPAVDQPELPPDTGPGLATATVPAKPQKSSPRPDSVLSDADIAELLETSQEELEGSVEATSMAGAARLGRASPYVRGVIRLLKKAMPKRVGAKGIVVVQFVVSDNGRVEIAQIIKSSGRAELDRKVLDSIHGTQFTVPNKGTNEQERNFQITYHYD